jgi:hypothetical protein
MAGIYEDEILGAQQQRDLARKLRDTEVPSTGHMIGDWYVAPTVAQQLSAVLKQGIGAYKENQAEDELKGLKQERARSSADAFSQMGMQAPSGLLAEAGTPAIKPSIMDRLGAALTFNAQPKGTPAQPYQQTIAQNPNETQMMGGILNLAGSNPEMAAVAQAMQGQKWTRENAAALAKQALIEKNAAREDTQAFQAQQNELTRLQAKILQDNLIANRPQPQAPQGSVVEIIDPKDNTKMIKINSATGQVYGTSGTEPKALIRQEKDQAKIDEQAKGQESFQSTLYNLRDEYKTLKSLGSIKTDQDSSIANALGVKLKTSTGQLLGTKTGTAISNIEQARKSIIQDIKNATGMSAGQLNSNFELQNMLATVTDPDSPYEAVQDQLNTLSQKFGTGEAIFPERLKFKQQANMVQGQAPVTTQSQVKSGAEKGWVLHTDAKGNKAYVNPQNPNEFEEVK